MFFPALEPALPSGGGTHSGASADGIGNVAFLPAGCALGNVTAFDTGPGNMVMGRIN